MAKPFHTQTLLVETRRLLKDRRQRGLTMLKIYEETGIPYYWLEKVLSGEVKDPGVNRVQILYEYLSGKKLAV